MYAQLPGIERAEQGVDGCVDRGKLLGADQSFRDAGLIGHHGQEQSAFPQAVQCAFRAGHRAYARGVVQIGAVLDDRVVAVEQHRQGWIAARGPECPLAVQSLSHRDRWDEHTGGRHPQRFDDREPAGQEAPHRELSRERQPGGARPPSGTTIRRRDGQHGRRRRHDVQRQPAAALADRGAPPATVFAAHERIVAVADLGPHTAEPRCPRDRMPRAPVSPDDCVARQGDSQCQVGILAVGAREPLVEAARADQRGPPIRHVRGDPLRVGQAQRALVVVGAAPPRLRRDVDDRLASGGTCGVGPGEILGQCGEPARMRQDVVVEEAHPARRGLAPSDVAGGRRSATAAAQ